VPLAQDVKKQIIAEYGSSESDTGSAEVQVAMLSRRISDLTEHLRFHKHMGSDACRPPSPFHHNRISKAGRTRASTATFEDAGPR
jgi:hypothetical protein